MASTPDPPSACGGQNARTASSATAAPRCAAPLRSGAAAGRRARRRSPTRSRRRAPAAKSRAAAGIENCPVSTAVSARLNRISAVASLTSPSPSSTAVIRRGMPRRSATASGATTSGGDTIAPSMNATPSGNPISQWPRPRRRAWSPSRNRLRAADRPQVRAKCLPAHRERREIDERRKQHQHHEVGIELHLRQPRLNASAMPARPAGSAAAAAAARRSRRWRRRRRRALRRYRGFR